MTQRLVLLAALALAVLHQDFWFRDDPTILFGFLPIGLAYHAGYTLTAAALWWAALWWAWPAEALREINDDESGDVR